MAWLVILYLGSLVVLLITAFWTVDPLSGTVIKELSCENFEELVNVPVYREIIWRTVRTALLVTLTDAVIAFPIAFYMAKVAGRKTKAAAGRRGADAALGELPGEDHRLAGDPRRTRGAELGAPPDRPARARRRA